MYLSVQQISGYMKSQWYRNDRQFGFESGHRYNIDIVWCQPLVTGQQVALVLGYRNAMAMCTRVACMCQIRFLAIIRFANSQDFLNHTAQRHLIMKPNILIYGIKKFNILKTSHLKNYPRRCHHSSFIFCDVKSNSAVLVYSEKISIDWIKSS